MGVDAGQTGEMSELLITYLQDHDAGARAGVDLFTRSAKAHSDPAVREELAQMREKVARERRQIQQMLRSVGGSPSRGKIAATWLGEKVARLKPNRRVASRSPLSDLWELEALLLAVRGKELGFDSLLALDDARLDRESIESLRENARHQQEKLQGMHDRTAARALRQD